MTECKKHGKMFEKMVKCQQSGFWAENVLIKAIKNWIQTKYSYSPSVRLLEYNFVSVIFSDDRKMEEYDKIMEDVCNEFHLEIKYLFSYCFFTTK